MRTFVLIQLPRGLAVAQGWEHSETKRIKIKESLTDETIMYKNVTFWSFGGCSGCCTEDNLTFPHISQLKNACIIFFLKNARR